MSAINIIEITDFEKQKILSLEEGHFCEVKSIEIEPAKLTRTISAFSNAEGGELYIGIDENKEKNQKTWRGFLTPEKANGFIQAFEKFFPLGNDYSYDFLRSASGKGLILKADVKKTKDIRPASDGKIYVRRGAQNLFLEKDEDLARLRLNKGLVSFETETISANAEFIVNSETTKGFMAQVVPHAESGSWLRKQQLIINDKPTVAGTVLFSDEPQALLPKRCGIKIYRYKSSATEGTREAMDFDPISIEGCAYNQIRDSVKRTQWIIQSINIRTSKGLENASYPREAIHEIITNAVLHRDYSIADDIHIKIFDNRVEVMSPGTLPGHVTPENILEERFARNGVIVRLINKFPEPPNKDVGEGLNTAFFAMRRMKLKDPLIEQSNGYVRVTLRHESLASPEQIIMDYLKNHLKIKNSIAREICYIGSENQMKRILQRMVRNGLIESVPGETRATAAYRLREKKTLQGDYVQGDFDLFNDPKKDVNK
jgi:ATP-dependent DNA helicase RecG